MKKCNYCNAKGYVSILPIVPEKNEEIKTTVCPICQGKKEVRYTQKVYSLMNKICRDLENKGLFDRPALDREIEKIK